MPDDGEPDSLLELLSRLNDLSQCYVKWRPRMRPGEEWKDPLGCCARMGITREEAKEIILERLGPNEFYKGPEDSHSEATPEKKWVFKAWTPPQIQPPRRLYIRISSKHSKEIYVESFHECEKPNDYIE